MQHIAFHGVPRSGTSWVGAIFDSSDNVAYRHQPLFSYAFKNYLNEYSTKEQIQQFFKKIRHTKDSFILQKDGKSIKAIPKFTKRKITHVVYKEARYHHILENMLHQDRELKVVGIIRNPKSVIFSWYNAPKEFNKIEWNLEDEWLNAKKKNKGLKEEFYGYNKWKEVALIFLRLKNIFPKRFHLIEYSNLLFDTENQVKNLFDFCKIHYDIQTEHFIKMSKSIDKSKDVYSVYRKNQVDNKWEGYLPKTIIECIDKDLINSKLNIFNYRNVLR